MKLSAVTLLGDEGEVLLVPEVPLVAPDPVWPALLMTVAKVDPSVTVVESSSIDVKKVHMPLSYSVPAQFELAAHVVKHSSSVSVALLAKMAKSMVIPDLEIFISMRKSTPSIVRIVEGVETAAPEVVEETPEEVREAEPVGREEVEFPAPVIPAGREEVALPVELELPETPGRVAL